MYKTYITSESHIFKLARDLHYDLFYDKDAEGYLINDEYKSVRPFIKGSFIDLDNNLKTYK